MEGIQVPAPDTLVKSEKPSVLKRLGKIFAVAAATVLVLGALLMVAGKLLPYDYGEKSSNSVLSNLSSAGGDLTDWVNENLDLKDALFTAPGQLRPATTPIIANNTINQIFSSLEGGNLSEDFIEDINNIVNQYFETTTDLPEALVGPAGPAGPTGATGATGATGEQGPRGSGGGSSGSSYTSPLTTEGDLLFYNGTADDRLARGANGECLTSDATTLVWGSCGAGSSSLSGLTAATAINTINNANFAQTWNWNSLAGENAMTLGSTSISSGSLFNLNVNSTAAASNTQKALNVSTAGANATGTQTTYGGYFSNTHTGTASTNVAAYFTASGGTNNYSGIFEDGNVGIGNTAPTAKLALANGSGTYGAEQIVNGSFTGGTTGWTLMAGCADYGTNNVVINYDAGCEAGDDYPAITTSISTVAGSTYELSFDVVAVNGDEGSYSFDNNIGYDGPYGVGTHTITYTATYTGADTLYLENWNWNDDGGWTVDNVSFRELNIIPTLEVKGYDGNVWFSLGNDLQDNYALGLQALALNSGESNMAFGSNSLQSNTTGDDNIGIGLDTLQANNTGSGNIAFGTEALYSNQSGADNIAIGGQVLRTNVNGSNNIGIGEGSLYDNVSGNTNVAIGLSSLANNIGGNFNLALGSSALLTNTSGSSNVAIGVSAMQGNTTGTGNTAIGVSSMFSNTEGFANVAIGESALRDNLVGAYNTAIGQTALENTTNVYYNVALGAGALRNNITGWQSVAVGVEAGGGIAAGSGDVGQVVLLGYQAGYNLQAGAVGNIAIGYRAGDNVTTGLHNVIIGWDIEAPSATTNNQLSIGNLIFGTALDGTGTTLSTGNIGIGDSSPAAKFTVGNGDLFQVNSSGQIAAVAGYIQGSGTMSITSANTTQTTTSSAVAMNFNSLTSGTGLYMASSSNVSGRMIDIVVSNASQTSTTALSIVQSGTSGGYTGNLVNITGTSTTGSGNVVNITTAATTAGSGLQLTANGITTGNGVNLVHGTSAISTGALLNVTSTAADALTTGGLVKISSNANFTTSANVTGLLNIVATGSTAGTNLNVYSNTPSYTGNLVNFFGSGVTTGRVLNVSMGLTLTTGGFMNVSNASYIHSTTETGRLASLSYTDTSSNASGTATTTGLYLSPIFNTTASAGAKVLNGIDVIPTFSACGTTGGSCTYNGVQSTTAARTQSTTNAMTMNAFLVSAPGALVQNTAAGTLAWNGLNITMPAITQTTGTVTSRGISITGGTVTSGTAYALTTDATAGNVGIGTTAPASKLEILTSATSATEATLRIHSGTGNASSILLRPFANDFGANIGFNQTFDGTNANRVDTAYGSFTIGHSTTTTPNTLTAGYAAAGANPLSHTAGWVLNDIGDFGVGTVLPGKRVDINSAAGNNLRLTYNDADGAATNYADFLTTSGGDLTITPSGLDSNVTGNLATTDRDWGNGSAGSIVTLGRNTNATNTGAGSVNFQSKAGTAGYVWQDNAGNLRLNAAAPTNANDVAGVVVGDQTSTRATKQNIEDYTDYAAALNMVIDAPLHTFKYKKDVQGYGANSPLAKARIGYIADEVSAHFMWGNSIDQVSVNGILMASVKQLNNKITTVQDQVSNFQGSGNLNMPGDAPIVLKAHLYLSEDSVGQAKILEGSKTVRITFAKPYEYQPIPTATIRTSISGSYWIENETAFGFTIRMSQSQNKDVSFNWHSFAGESAKLTVSDGTVAGLTSYTESSDDEDVVDEPQQDEPIVEEDEPIIDDEPVVTPPVVTPPVIEDPVVDEPVVDEEVTE